MDIYMCICVCVSVCCRWVGLRLFRDDVRALMLPPSTPWCGVCVRQNHIDRYRSNNDAKVKCDAMEMNRRLTVVYELLRIWLCTPFSYTFHVNDQYRVVFRNLMLRVIDQIIFCIDWIRCLQLASSLRCSFPFVSFSSRLLCALSHPWRRQTKKNNQTGKHTYKCRDIAS